MKMTYGEMLEQAHKDVYTINVAPRITLKAISRPLYDNRRLGDRINWIVDNYSECHRYYHNLPGQKLWTNEAVQFMDCQYESQKFNIEWDEKHDGEYRDQINKERFDIVRKDTCGGYDV